MSIYAIIPTKEGDYSLQIVQDLESYGVTVILMVGQDNIYDAHIQGIETIRKRFDAKDDDIAILCHDDIELLSSKRLFDNAMLVAKLDHIGIHGVAGTKVLRRSGIWWDSMQHPGETAGMVMHSKGQGKEKFHTIYGPDSFVTAVDGVFMFGRLDHWERVTSWVYKDFAKGICGGWNFYDIRYSIASIELAKCNYVTTDIMILHYSLGETADRTDWHINRESFLRQYQNILPLQVKWV